MNCNLQKIAGTVYVCTNVGCGRLLKIERAKPSKVKLPCRGMEPSKAVPSDVAARAKEIAAREVIDLSGPPHGPGTEFRKLASSFGYEPKGCACNATEAKMNRLGVDGCRKAIDELAAEIIANASQQGVELIPEAAIAAIEEACRLAELTALQTTENPAA